jgi:hypothetical protein
MTLPLFEEHKCYMKVKGEKEKQIRYMGVGYEMNGKKQH